SARRQRQPRSLRTIAFGRIELFETLAEAMDVDPGSGIVPCRVGLTEHGIGDLGLRRRGGTRPPRGEIVEQFAQAPCFTQGSAGTDPRDFCGERLWRASARPFAPVRGQRQIPPVTSM